MIVLVGVVCIGVVLLVVEDLWVVEGLGIVVIQLVLEGLWIVVGVVWQVGIVWTVNVHGGSGGDGSVLYDHGFSGHKIVPSPADEDAEQEEDEEDNDADDRIDPAVVVVIVITVLYFKISLTGT